MACAVLKEASAQEASLSEGCPEKPEEEMDAPYKSPEKATRPKGRPKKYEPTEDNNQFLPGEHFTSLAQSLPKFKELQGLKARSLKEGDMLGCKAMKNALKPIQENLAALSLCRRCFIEK